MIAKKKYLSPLILLMSMLCMAGAVERDDLVFGLSNLEGTKIITLGYIENVDLIKSVISPDMKISKVEFSGDQKAHPNYNGRPSSHKFDQIPGKVFKLNNSTIKKPGVCLLTSPNFVKGLKLLKVTNMGYSKISNDLLQRIQKEKNRKIVDAWMLAELESEWKIIVVFFESIESDALASLVVLNQETVYFKDFPAKYDKQSTWRVDDGGKFNGKDFIVLFAYKREKEIGLVYSWFGFEGESLAVIETKDGQTIELKNGYIYHAPQ
jgi:hypothetical protein